ncbi:PilN domain-containing protein [Candidatus Woesebacteria bacterium]|nr:MAG: PilN domain-containing protein [Candidatus Woesebacteria bacterium]
MAARKKNSQINLMPQEGFSATTAGRVLFWILSSFRIIVIVTEIIVMFAFLSRFWLDANNTDLNEEIQQKSSLIAARQGFESEFRDVQGRTEIFDSLTKNEGTVSTAMENIVKSLPPDVTLEEVEFDKPSVTISGFSSSERSIQQFIVNVSAKKTFTNIGLSEISADVENPSILEFAIIAEYNL